MYVIWIIGSLFVLFQFFLQLSSGIVIGVIMHDMHLTALTAGVLSSSFYIVYTSLQIPVGILFDHHNPRILLAANALLCSIGCIIFASSYSLTYLFIGRTIMGVGSAFAFVGLTHLLRQHFPLYRFAFLIGLSETLGFIATVLGIIGMGSVIMIWGWRQFIEVAGLFGAIIAGLCWCFIPNTSLKTSRPVSKPLKVLLKTHWGNLTTILYNKIIWANGLFIGLSFSIVTVFGALWAPSFIQIKLDCSLRQASLINAMFFLGTGFSCPLFGVLSNYFTRRKPLILISCLITTGLLLGLLYLPITTVSTMGILMLMLGLSCGAYILAYPIANELAPVYLLSTCAGFTNTLALITTPILQPLIGYLLDAKTTTKYYSVSDYQSALLVIPASLLCATMLVFFLPEKKTQ